MSTLAFAVCFACWLLNGVLITFLVDSQTFTFSKAQMGWLLGLPVLTGSIARLPVGLLTDRFGGRVVYTVLMLVSAVPMYLTSHAGGYAGFLWAGLGFGLAGASFAVGVAYVALFFPPHRVGTALGIFGVGNVGAALTNLLGPRLLGWLSDAGRNPDGWRTLPKLYAVALVVMAVLFYFTTQTRLPAPARDAADRQGLTLLRRLAPLGSLRVWRFGLYYATVFGGFVALSQWMVPYYVSVYNMSVSSAGFMAACFSLPSALTRSLGGWLSDRFGARTVMYWVFGGVAMSAALLTVPRMDIESPGEGVLAAAAGTVREVSAERIVVGDRSYALRPRVQLDADRDRDVLVLPTVSAWQEPVVRPGDRVAKRQLLARGTTHIYVQANVHMFSGVLFVAGCAMGIGMAAVYKHIPYYFPNAVGVTGGMVGVLGGLGGFICPILFGYLLRATGLWTSCWLFLTMLTLLCLGWMHWVVRRMLHEQAPQLAQQLERHSAGPRA
jgi:NNP family nitrate/nitrite transporter-like MFS transporter